MSKEPKKPFVVNSFIPLKTVMRRYVLWALEESGFDKHLASKKTGVCLKTVYNKIAEQKENGDIQDIQ